MSARVHRYSTSSEFADIYEKNGGLTEYYYRRFGDDLKDVIFHDDKATQLRGIDKTLVFNHGVEVTVDEKVDSYDSGNFALETATDVRKPYSSWLFTSEADYVPYAFTRGLVHPFPLKALRGSYNSHYLPDGNHEWTKYIAPVQNVNYTGAIFKMPKELLMNEVYRYECANRAAPMWHLFRQCIWGDEWNAKGKDI